MAHQNNTAKFSAIVIADISKFRLLVGLSVCLSVTLRYCVEAIKQKSHTINARVKGHYITSLTAKLLMKGLETAKVAILVPFDGTLVISC